MIPSDDELAEGRGEELAALIVTLHDTQQRILELTGSAVDAVLHPSGQHYLMRGAQDDLRESVQIERRHATERAAILNALPARVALLDSEGYIVIVNEAWRRFAAANHWPEEDCGVGRNYREICARTVGQDPAKAAEAGPGVSAVLAGTTGEFSLEYPFRVSGREHWYRMTATPVHGLSGGAVVMHVDVTQRRQAEKELDQANRLLRIAARTSRMGGWSVDLAKGRVDWSDEVCAIHDLPPGTNPSVDHGIDFYAPESRNRIREVFEACARDGIPYDEELEILTARGARKWVRSIGEPVRDPDGSIVGVHGAFQDLTPIKDAEAAALLGERRFHQLAETLPQIVWTAEPDGTVDFISADFYRQTGLERLDRAAWDWLEALHPDDRNRCLRSWEESVARGAEHRIEFRIWDAGQRDYRWHVITARPVRDAGGAIVKWYGAAIDIHDRRLAEEALTQAQQRNRLILAAAGEGIAGLDSDGRVVFENPAASRMLGYEAGEMIGSHYHALAHRYPDGGEHPVEACPIHQTLEDGQTRRAEDDVLFRKDGSSFPAALTCTPTIDEATGAITGAVVIFRDVTEQRALEEQLHQSQRLDALGRLTGGIAHDFNNLLTVILGNAELLAERLEDDPESLRMAETTRAMAERAADLTLRLLAFARRQPLAMRPTDVGALLDAMEELLRRTLGEHVDIRLRCAEGLWPALVDPLQLENAILNLGINARDAMPSGGMLRIEATNAEFDVGYAEPADGASPGAFVRITVSDTGIGMTPETAGRAFDPFFTTKPAGKGSGLGLSTVFGFVKQSGGHMTLSTEPGEGTTFTLYLPRAEDRPAAPAAQPSTEPTAGRAERILYVEDNEVVRQHVDGLLEGLGYAVTSVESGEDALAALGGGGRFDLLFTDVVLAGGMSGPQLAERLRAIEPGLPVLFTSGYAETGLSDSALEPAALLLPKPFRKEDLAARLRQALDSYGQRDAGSLA